MTLTMSVQGSLVLESFMASFAFKTGFLGMKGLMVFKIHLLGETLTACITQKRFFFRVDFSVRFDGALLGKGLVADLTGERFFFGVDSAVCEKLALADKGLWAGVTAERLDIVVNLLVATETVNCLKRFPTVLA